MQEPTQATAERAEDEAGRCAQQGQLGVGRRPSSWTRRKMARLHALQQRPPTARQHSCAALGAADATPPGRGTSSRPRDHDVSAVDGRCIAKAPAAEAPPYGASSDSQHCRGADGYGSGSSDMRSEPDSCVPGWVDFFGKDPPPGWTCSPLEEWGFNSDEDDDKGAACSGECQAGEPTAPEHAPRNDSAAAPGPQSVALPAGPSNALQDAQRAPDRQPEATKQSTAVKPPPVRTPRGWRSPVDMLIPRAASLHCSGHRRRYGLPVAREPQRRPLLDFLS